MIPNTETAGMNQKTRNLQGVIESTANVFQELVRLEECLRTTKTITHCVCMTCGDRVVNGNKKLHAGHYKKRSNLATLFERHNIGGQCEICNTRRGGLMKVMRRELAVLYGEPEMQRIEFIARKPKHFYDFTFEWLDEHRKQWQAEIKKLKGLV